MLEGLRKGAMMAGRSVVVVGAGLAAARLVEALRKGGFDGRITLIGDEPHRPYDRPGLSKEVLQGEADAAAIYLHPASFYADKQIDTHFGDAAACVDREAGVVWLASGRDVPYDDLVFATGSRARLLDLPGADLHGVLTLRRMEDEAALRRSLDAGERVVLVGGGWIGLEVAAAAAEAGCQVTVLEGLDLPLVGVLGPELAGHIAALHRAHGVDLRTGVTVEGFEGVDGRVTGVRVDGSVVPADVVVVGVGAIPNAELAAASGLVVDNGILVDEHLRTDDPHVGAIGDVANAYNTTLGRHVRVEHWDNARRQGRFLASVLLGREGSYDWQPYFYSDQYDMSLDYLGRAGRDAHLVVKGDPASGAYLASWLEGGVVTAALQVNTPRAAGPLRKVVGMSLTADQLQEQDLADLVT